MRLDATKTTPVQQLLGIDNLKQAYALKQSEPATHWLAKLS